MYEGYYVQVQDKGTGDSYPIPEAGYDPKLHRKLDDPPIHPITGEPLSAKPRTTVRREAAKKSTAKKPTAKKATRPGGEV